MASKLCFFEINYLQSPSSTLEGKSIRDVRYNLGVQLAKEFMVDVDFVTYLPESPEFMARGYSDESKIPFLEAFYKIKTKRSFLEATPEERGFSIKNNLFVFDNLDLKNKSVVLVDDSVVRGTNAPCTVKKLKERGVKKIYLLSSTPIIGEIISGVKHGCLYGVDMPPRDNFAIRRFENLDEMAEEFGLNAIYFLSHDGLSKAQWVSLEERCTFCIGGKKVV